MDHLSVARQYQLRSFVCERAASPHQRRGLEIARYQDDEAESAVSGSQESISQSRCVARGSGRQNLAQLTGGTQWRNPVRGGLSLDQRMPRLRPRRLCHLHLEFRCSGKISWDVVYGNDSGTTLAASPRTASRPHLYEEL